MDIEEKRTFYFIMVLLAIGAVFNSILLWNTYERIAFLNQSIESELPNLENFGNEIEQLIAKNLSRMKNSSNQVLEFLDVPYCSASDEEGLTIIVISKNLTAKIWDIKGKDFSEYLNRQPDFNARLYHGTGGVSIQFTNEDATYFPHSFSFNQKGEVLSFLILDSFYSPCAPLNNR